MDDFKTQPLPTKPSPKPSRKTCPAMCVVLLVLSALLLGGVAGYFLGLNQSYLPLPPEIKFIKGIKATSCCPCPELVRESQIGIDSWEKYEEGKNYSNCPHVLCLPCQSLSERYLSELKLNLLYLIYLFKSFLFSRF